MIHVNNEKKNWNVMLKDIIFSHWRSLFIDLFITLLHGTQKHLLCIQNDGKFSIVWELT